MCILPKFTAYFRCSNGRFFPGFGPRQLSGLNAAYLETICAQIFHSALRLLPVLWAGRYISTVDGFELRIFHQSWGKFTDQFWQIGVKFAFSHSPLKSQAHHEDRGQRRNASVWLSILVHCGDLFLNQITSNNHSKPQGSQMRILCSGKVKTSLSSLDFDLGSRIATLMLEHH